MKNKLFFLAVVLLLLLAVIFTIGVNKRQREKERVEEIARIEKKKMHDDSIKQIRLSEEEAKAQEERIRVKRQQFIKDSLQAVQEIERIKNKNIIKTEQSIKKEDFDSYINSSITKSSDKINIAVTILNENGGISSVLSNSIASIYSQNGYKGITGLLRSSFIQKPSFLELYESNSEIIDKLQLNKYTDYVALGRVNYSFRKGTAVNNTWVCTASLTMNIISANKKHITESFSISANGNGSNEEQAKDSATQKLLNKYFSEYSEMK